MGSFPETENRGCGDAVRMRGRGGGKSENSVLPAPFAAKAQNRLEPRGNVCR